MKKLLFLLLTVSFTVSAQPIIQKYITCAAVKKDKKEEEWTKVNLVAIIDTTEVREVVLYLEKEDAKIYHIIGKIKSGINYSDQSYAGFTALDEKGNFCNFTYFPGALRICVPNKPAMQYSEIIIR